MQFTRKFKVMIRDGSVTVSYRAWQRPRVRIGGRYNLHPQGAIEVTGLTQIDAETLTSEDARAAGHVSLDELLRLLEKAPGSNVYRVDFRYLGDALVNQPETAALDPRSLQALQARLTAMDTRNGQAWTRPLLHLLAARPGRRAADLADELGWQTAHLKSQVRKLKALGLTISLDIGYRLSDRGTQLLASESAQP